MDDLISDVLGFIVGIIGIVIVIGTIALIIAFPLPAIALIVLLLLFRG